MKNKIQKYRKQANLTQAEVGQALKCSPGCISNYERSDRSPDVLSVKMLIALFRSHGINTDFDDLFSEDETPEESVA